MRCKKLQINRQWKLTSTTGNDGIDIERSLKIPTGKLNNHNCKFRKF